MGCNLPPSWAKQFVYSWAILSDTLLNSTGQTKGDFWRLGGIAPFPPKSTYVVSYYFKCNKYVIDMMTSYLVAYIHSLSLNGLIE